jgi:hypothetical protein
VSGSQGKNVDASPVAGVVEADLDSDDPSPRFEHPDESVLEFRVPFVEQARQALTLPAHVQPQPGIERLDAGAELPDRDVVEPVVLDPRDHVARHPDAAPELALRPTLHPSERLDTPSDPPSAHGPMVARRRLPPA